MNKKYIELTDKQRKIIYVISIVLFVLLMAFLSVFVGRPLVKYAKDPKQFKQWIDSFGIYSRLIFVLITTLQVVVALIPGEPFEIAAGYCFGTIEGLLLALISIVLGSFIIFKLVRRYGKSIISVFFNDKDVKRLEFLKDPIKLKNILFIINLIPGTPKDLISYVVGLTPISLRNWLIISFLSRIPSVITSTLAGEYLYKQEYKTTINVFFITLIISLIGLVIYNYITKNKKNNQK